jgi:hypothetical protein
LRQIIFLPFASPLSIKLTTTRGLVKTESTKLIKKQRNRIKSEGTPNLTKVRRVDEKESVN